MYSVFVTLTVFKLQRRSWLFWNWHNKQREDLQRFLKRRKDFDASGKFFVLKVRKSCNSVSFQVTEMIFTILEMAQQAEKIETEILYRKRERNCKTGMKQHLFKVLYCKPVSAYKKVTEQLRKLDELHVF